MSEESREVVMQFATRMAEVIEEARQGGATPAEVSGVLIGAGVTLGVVAGASEEEIQDIVRQVHEENRRRRLESHATHQ